MKKLIYLLLLAVLPIAIMGQSEKSIFTPNLGVAVGVSGSTNGLGVSAVAAFNDYFALRLSYEALNMTLSDLSFDMGDQPLNVSPTVKTGGVSVLLDIYLLKNFYISAGVVSTAFNPSAIIHSTEPLEIGDITYTPDEMGELRLAVKPQNKVAPYAAIGFGRNISRDKRLAMSFELGVYHMGSYVVDLSGTNFFEGNNTNTSVDNLNETLNDISWSGLWPAFKLGISYKLYGNKK